MVGSVYSGAARVVAVFSGPPKARACSSMGISSMLHVGRTGPWMVSSIELHACRSTLSIVVRRVK